MYMALRELAAILWGISIGMWIAGACTGWFVLTWLLVAMLINAVAEQIGYQLWEKRK